MDGKSSQEYPFNAGVLQGFILGPTFFLLYINDLCDDVICNIAIYADDIPSIRSLIRHLICGNNLNWLLNLIYETLDWCQKWFVDFNSGKTELVSFDRSNNNDSIDVKRDGSMRKIIF